MWIADWDDRTIDGSVFINEVLTYVARFRDSVADVQNALPAKMTPIELHIRRQHGLPTEPDDAQMWQPAVYCLGSRDTAEQRRNGVVNGDLQAVQPIDDLGGGMPLGIEWTDGGAVQEGSEYVGDGN